MLLTAWDLDEEIMHGYEFDNPEFGPTSQQLTSTLIRCNPQESNSTKWVTAEIIFYIFWLLLLSLSSSLLLLLLLLLVAAVAAAAMRWAFWVVVSFILVHHGCFGCLKEEKIALLELKAFLYAEDASALPSWDDKNSNCCRWENIECNSTTEKVIGLFLSRMDLGELNLNVSMFLPFKELKVLNLSSSMLTGWIDEESFEKLAKLKRLQILDLSNNQFNGSIAKSVSVLTSLRTLSLGANVLSISDHTEELANLDELVELDLSNNGLDHFIPVQGLRNLSKLSVLNLNDNDFSASTLPSLGALPLLRRLHLAGNQLNGTTAIEGTLKKLEVLDLSDNKLNMSILHSIELMTFLKALSLRNNALNGSLPYQGLCKLKVLEELDLSGNSLEGSVPSCFEGLTSLRALDLSKNRFSGNITSSLLASFNSLEFLSLSHNVFQYLAPFSSFGDNSKLEAFELVSDYNGLLVGAEDRAWVPKFQLKIFRLSNCTLKDRSFPAFLYHQHNLRVLDLSHNSLEGGIPSWLIESNTMLQVLKLKNNSLSGSFPLPSHPNANASTLDISENLFHGQIPSNISILYPNLVLLNMSENSFVGSIPPSLGDMKELVVLDLSYNALTGGIPDDLALGCFSLEVLKLSNNSLSGPMFPKFFNLTRLSYLLLDRNHFSGQIPDSLCNSLQLQLLDISNNYVSGKIPTCIGVMVSLETFYMNDNHLEGHIPEDFCSLGSLQRLDLSSNNLSGSIPSCFSPSLLIHARLRDNRLAGPLKAFSQSSFLVTLDLKNNRLSGPIPSWISKLESLSNFLLSRNSFGGKIPSGLCELSQLTILDLSHNHFSGSIPSCLDKIPFKIGFRSGKYVKSISFSEDSIMQFSYQGRYIDFPTEPEGFTIAYEKEEVEITTKSRPDYYKGNALYLMNSIDLSSNRLMGGIPPEIGNLTRLLGLNLSHNVLTGSIPKEFSGLEKIESLDLSYNKLRGKIPSQLTELYDLAVFNVSYNNLSGEIPETKQFATFSGSSYVGNPLLCGFMINKSCDKVKEAAPVRQEEGFMDMVYFRWSFTGGYVGILVVLLSVISLNQSWRRQWFEFIDKINELICWRSASTSTSTSAADW